MITRKSAYVRFALVAAMLLSSRFLFAGQMFPPGSPPSSCLDVVDLRDARHELKLAAATLQGLINRGAESRAYLLLAEWDVFWLRELEETGAISKTNPLSPEAFFQKYRETYDSVIIYDPALPATINIAAMMASLSEAVVVAPDHEGWISAGKSTENVCGRWATNTAAYEWAFETLWPKMNQRLLACYHPTATQHHMRDYFVRHRVFHFWVTSEEREDGKTSSHAAERAFAEKLLAVSPVNVPVLGFWFSGPDRGLDEYRGVGLAGAYGKLTVPCDWATNLSLHSGVKVDLDAAATAHQKRLVKTPRAYPADRVYLCHSIVESGDAPSYLQSRQHQVWQDPARGGISINWAMGPAIFELAPLVAAHFYNHATPNDYIFMALSGAAYCHPYRDFMARVPLPENAWKEYLSLTGAAMKRMGCQEMVLYTDAWKPYSRIQHDAVTRRFAEAIPDLRTIVLGMGRDEGMDSLNGNYWLDNSTLVSHVLTRWPLDYAERSREENIAWQVAAIKEQTPAQRPAFLHVMALSWAFGPGEIAEIHQQLGPEYEALSIPQFHEAFRQHHPLLTPPAASTSSPETP